MRRVVAAYDNDCEKDESVTCRIISGARSELIIWKSDRRLLLSEPLLSQQSLLHELLNGGKTMSTNYSLHKTRVILAVSL